MERIGFFACLETFILSGTQARRFISIWLAFRGFQLFPSTIIYSIPTTACMQKAEESGHEKTKIQLKIWDCRGPAAALPGEDAQKTQRYYLATAIQHQTPIQAFANNRL